MDELEISGKRYISTRRAGKEHKYSSDYIGQLIRGKKVVGQKVGRSWYVEETSLAEYLSKEKGEPASKAARTTSKKEASREEVIVESIHTFKEDRAFKVEDVTPARQEVKNIVRDEPIVTNVKLNAIARKETVEERAYRIPINMKEKKGLVYLSDDQPLLPTIEKRKTRATPSKQTSTLPAQIVADESHEEETILPIQKKHSPILKSFVVITIGAIVCAVVAGLSVSVTSHMVFEEGKAFHTQLSL